MDQIFTWDKNALIWINSHHNSFLDALLIPISYAGELAALWIILSLGMLIFGKSRERKTALLFIIVLLVVDRVFSAMLGHMLPRVRPCEAIEGIRQLGIHWTSGSFPSGHAHSVWLATIIFGSRYPKWIIPMVVFSVLTCYSRPYMGMHYPLDVIGGSLLGVAAGFATLGIERLIVKQKSKREPK